MALDLIILSGFLGSGKTTLLAEWLRRNVDHRVGVIINEVGAIDIDGATVLSAKTATPVAKLPSGCLCCSLRGSLVDSILSLLQASTEQNGEPLERIIIETSGLSLPGPIVASLGDRELLSIGMNVHIVCVLDCVNGIKNASNCDELSAQLVAAQRIVLTKQDLVNEDSVEEVRQYATSLNPMAAIIAGVDKAEVADQAFKGGAGDGRKKRHEFLVCEDAVVEMRHPKIKVYSRRLSQPLDWKSVAWWFDDLSFYFGERLLRSKCLLRIEGESNPILMQSVGHVYSRPTVLDMSEPAGSEFVFILRDVPEPEFESMFQQIHSLDLVST